MGKVLISGLTVHGIIGIHDHERQTPQDFVIHLEMSADLAKAGETDDIADCVDYQRVSEKILAHAQAARRYTVEALAADVARIALAEPGVTRAKVRVEKPNAVASCRSVGVEIERNREPSG